jgi:hypothetical protein
MAIEDYIGMSIFPITYKAYYSSVNASGTEASFDLPEVSQDFNNQAGTVITSVGFWNTNTPPTFTTLANTQYYYDPTGNKVVCTSIPTGVNNFMTNPIIVTWTTKANFYAQYPNIKQAGLLLLTHLYNNRSNTTVETLKTLPFGVDQLLRPYKPLVM